MPEKEPIEKVSDKTYPEMIKGFVKELQKVFSKQGHSGHSAYCTVLGFAKEYFEGEDINPAWIISRSPSVVTVGGPQTLNIIPLNKEARMRILSVKVFSKIDEKAFKQAWNERPKRGFAYDKAKWIILRYLELVKEDGERKEAH